MRERLQLFTNQEQIEMNKYKHVKGLGNGGFGSAMLVELRSFPAQKYVIKEVDLRTLPDRDIVIAKAEAEVLRTMNHSNITTYIESFVEEKKLYIVMENANGGDLFSAIESRNVQGTFWTEDEALYLFAQMCLALNHVHKENVLHRDIKPHNIFLTENNIVKLGDFGASKVLAATNALAKTRAGTYEYWSPEVCKGQMYGRACDVWSLGVVLFQMLALELPFDDSCLPIQLDCIMNREPDYSLLEERYSAKLIDLVKNMLKKDPLERPSMEQILKSDLLRTHIRRVVSYTYRFERSHSTGKPMTLTDLFFGACYSRVGMRKAKRAYKALNISRAQRVAIEQEAAANPDRSTAWKKVYHASNVRHLEALSEKMKLWDPKDTPVPVEEAAEVNQLVMSIEEQWVVIAEALRVLAQRFAEKNWSVYMW